LINIVVRVWLPDLPGALGRVASALGSADASLTGIDILERGSGWAVDELVVEVAESADAIARIANALNAVDGVSVEDARVLNGEPVDPRLDALETVAELVEQTTRAELFRVLVRRSAHDMSGVWVALVDSESGVPLQTEGEGPSAPWMRAFIAGSQSSSAIASGGAGPDDIAWTELPALEATLIVGRDGRPFRERERYQLSAFARIADHCLRRLLP